LFWFLENKKKIKKINIIEIFFVPRKTRAKNKQVKKNQKTKQKTKNKNKQKLQITIKLITSLTIQAVLYMYILK
jgi:hypothetical protein